LWREDLDVAKASSLDLWRLAKCVVFCSLVGLGSAACLHAISASERDDRERVAYALIDEIEDGSTLAEARRKLGPPGRVDRDVDASCASIGGIGFWIYEKVRTPRGTARLSTPVSYCVDGKGVIKARYQTVY
jgi:hypothetical protein